MKHFSINEKLHIQGTVFLITMKIEHKIIFVLFVLSSLSMESMAEINGFGGSFWNQQSLNGAVILEGRYRSLKTVLENRFDEFQKTAIATGRLLLRSRSYIWHPNFMLLNIDLDYQPGNRRDNYLVIPDRSETQIAERGHIEAAFFDQRPLSVVLFSNLNHSYINRELLTNIETYKTDFGGMLRFRNRSFPSSLRYLQERWSQKELATGRQFRNRRKNLTCNVSQSFSSRDAHQLLFAWDDYRRDYGSGQFIENKVSSINLRDNFFFDKEQSSSLNSLVWYYHQTGNEQLNRFQLFENVGVRLPKNFRFLGNYQYARFSQPTLSSNRHNFNSRLEHQLFLSLRSMIFYEYSFLRQSHFSELNNTVGLGLKYRKKIPYGIFMLNYEFRRRHQNRSSRPGVLTIVNEEHRLEDAAVILLDNPFVIAGSVVVHDATGTIIYQENLDYVLIQQGNFLEIQRLPGGEIPAGAAIFINYTAEQQLSFQFNSFGNNVGTNVSLFNQLMEFYFTFFNQDNSNYSLPESRILKYITRRVYGIRSSYSFISAGFEFDDYNSNIIPYESKRFYIAVSGQLAERVDAVITGNYRDYLLNADNERQKFSDFSGRVNYRIFQNSRFSMEGGYRIQNGRGIDLKLSTFRGEFSTLYRRIILTLGYETYFRKFSDERRNFNGTFLRIQRQF
ncbi:MAG: hypothetical protein P8184_05480 [Calditrichia bacterium]